MRDEIERFTDLLLRQQIRATTKVLLRHLVVLIGFQAGLRRRSERSSRLIEQLALTFEELEADATEDELAAERAAAKTTTVRGFTRKRAERQTFPEHLPRERVVIDPPTACECCGSNRLRKLGEDVTRTLEVVPRQWK